MNNYIFLRIVFISITLFFAIFLLSGCEVFVASTKPRQTAIPEDNGLTILTSTTSIPPETYSEYLSEQNEITSEKSDDDDHYYTETEVPGRETFKDTVFKDTFKDTAFSFENSETTTKSLDETMVTTTVPPKIEEETIEKITTTVPDEINDMLENLPPVPSENIIER